VTAPELVEASEACRGALARLGRHPQEAGGEPALLEAGARRFAFGLARVAAAALLLRQASWALRHEDPSAPRWLACAQRWCQRDLAPLLAARPGHLGTSRRLVE
jgi:hypothetical protein